MQNDAHFDPIEASRNLKSGFIDYITTTFPITDQVYRKSFREALGQEGFLTRGPYLDMSGSYKAGRSLNTLMEVGLVSQGFAQLEPVPEKDRELKLERPLYLHQEQALLKADAGKNLIVTTGTGSGKTECFLLPILQELLQEEQEKGSLDSGVRAILIYPMNALANDQMKRMRKILNQYPNITFGIYTGNTKHSESEAKTAYRKSYGKKAVILPNEMLSRERMQQEPPHILITNYSMLEYMMLRPKDDKVFNSAKLRYIVLDEAHVYKGTTGMETAMLMRRLRARIAMAKEGLQARKVQFILTSATLGGKDADQDITHFGHQLCGVEFDPADIIRSEDATPEMTAHELYPLEMLRKLGDTALSVADVLAEYGIADPAPEGDDSEKLYELMLRSALFADLRREAHRMELQALSQALGITRQQLLDLVAVCTRAEKGNTALLKARIHYFVRALEGAYITLGENPRMMLTRQKQTRDGKSVFEAAICHDCGRLALVGREEKEHLVQVARNTDKDPKDFSYFLLWDKNKTDDEYITFEDEDLEEAELEEQTDELDYAVCVCCGTITGWANRNLGHICSCDPYYEPVHVRRVIPTKNGKIPRCPACGHGEFRSFYLGNEAATAVLGTELFEQLPIRTVKAKKKEVAVISEDEFDFGDPEPQVTEEERTPQFLCFSDSRSEAAHFAVYMENAYQDYLRKRGIWQVVDKLAEQGKYTYSVSAFVNELQEVFVREQSFEKWGSDHDQGSLESISRRNAWIAIIDELYRSRNTISLSAMGLLHFRYASAKYQAIGANIRKTLVQQSNLSEADADALMQRLFLDGVYTGAVYAGTECTLYEADRESIFYNGKPKRLVKVKSANKGSESKVEEIGWLPKALKNGGYRRNTRVRRVMKATGWSEEKAYNFLRKVWDALGFGDGQFAFDVAHFQICLNAAPGVKTWRCKRCGNVTAHNLQNRCAVLQCDGELEEVSPEVLQESNHYTRRYRGDRMKPLQMREHTAQLSRDCQTQYQQAFVDGKLNALSCSTTFEMGVDVGGLETVYMRDVPPGPANYVQRAGRAGRAAHTAAYVLTYAKLSSHDFTFYNDPEKVIAGQIKAPVFALENEKVLYRHIFAVALAEFFAKNEDVYGGNNRYYLLNDGGYEKLEQFLNQPQERLDMLLARSVPSGMHQRLGITDGSWKQQLIGEKGILKVAVAEYRSELARLLEEREKARQDGDDDRASTLGRQYKILLSAPQPGFFKNRKELIEFLTRNNILPKYGFPVDTVELQIGPAGSEKDKGLQLSRDLQMAIAEYAPGAEIIADGKMYTSRYIRRSSRNSNNDSGWEMGLYAKCSCGEGNFRTSYGDGKCISCGSTIGNWQTTLEPRLGFIAENADGKRVPMHRPERDYKTDDYYVGSGSSKVLQSHEFQVGQERIRLQSTTNDSLAVVGYGEHTVCPYCGYTSDDKEPLKIGHDNTRGFKCSYDKKGYTVHLSHTFKTDVAAITFWTPDAVDYDTMISVLYALLEGLSKELDIERTDIKGCLHRINYKNSGKPIHSIILYDAVAGGAGHVRRIVTEDGAVFRRVLAKALQIVQGCSCDPSCYACIRNYYNQKIHNNLNRKKAAAFLVKRMGELVPVEAQDQGKSAANRTAPEAGSPDANSSTVEISDRDPAEGYSSWRGIDNAMDADEGIGCAVLDDWQIPRKGCLVAPTVRIDNQELENMIVYLAWEKQKLLLVDEIDQAEKGLLTAQGWHVDTMAITKEALTAALKGDN